uniref:Uncharacterized protein n=1 Tax=Hyaloperonospora arabidopsidis (strain Emoy2) TaxID=559515 RepID=M4BQU2_HYAAE
MCLWVAASSMSMAQRQANDVFLAVEKASVIEFNLTIQPTTSSESVINVTGQLQPRLSKCSQRLYFNGRMTVTTSNATEVFVLKNHRGYRHLCDASSMDATCLTPQDIPPLHTLPDTVHSAFRPSVYGAFAVDCTPLQFTFYDTPFVVCAEDWLRATSYSQQSMLPTSNDEQPRLESDPVLVVHGKKSTMRLLMLNNSESFPIDAGLPFESFDHCEYLEAPMTSGESCSNRTLRCPSPRADACKKQGVHEV